MDIGVGGGGQRGGKGGVGRGLEGVGAEEWRGWNV